MRITAKVAREMAEATSRVKENLDDIDYRIDLYANWGMRESTHMFNSGVDNKEVRDTVIEDLRDRGFHVRYGKIQYIFGIKEIIIKW